jgi:hypothetical protein
VAAVFSAATPPASVAAVAGTTDQLSIGAVSATPRRQVAAGKIHSRTCRAGRAELADERIFRLHNLSVIEHLQWWRRAHRSGI